MDMLKAKPFPSTAGGGRYSRIVPRCDEGATVTTARSDVHYLVTGHGIADLRGKSLGKVIDLGGTEV
jgi:4-hydroxybutyrate CoA-transferase